MFGLLFRREIIDKLTSLRFILILAAAMIIMVTGTVSFVSNFKVSRENYYQINNANQRLLQEASSKGLGRLFTYQIVPLRVRESGLIIQAGERELPNVLIFNPHIIQPPRLLAPLNPYVEGSKPIDWTFLAAVLFSFMALALSYDSISGERSDGSLQIALSNSLPRSLLLSAKYTALLSILILSLIFSVLIGMLTALLSGFAIFSPEFLSVLARWLFLTVIYLSIFVLLGMLVSVLVRKPSICMMSLLLVWVILTLMIPSSARLFAVKTEKILSNTDLAERTDNFKLFLDILKNEFPPESKAGNSMGQNPTTEHFNDRAKLYHRVNEMHNLAMNEYWNGRINQAVKARNLTRFSPTGSYKIAVESMVDAGLVRFERNLTQVRLYQDRFRQWVGEADKRDPDSRRWYRPSVHYATFVSDKPVDYESVPQFVEQPAPLTEAAGDVIWQLGYLLFLNFFLFALTWVAFLRADVRRMG